jgi:hypothetical protein
MTIAIRATVILTLALAIAGDVSGQETTATTETAAETSTATTTAVTEKIDNPASYETRNLFTALLRRVPPEVTSILVLDPTLLSNETYLAGYPDLAEFLARHPEVRRNPRFYLAEFKVPGQQQGVLDEALEGLAIFFTFFLIALALAWFIRTVIEQKRWNRLSRAQSEVHNKIMDRFGTSQELLEYIRTPAGTKFLEAAPISLHAERSHSAPLTRIMWSIQLGVVVVALGLGMLLVSIRYEAETSQDLFAMGMIAFSIGAGFIGSALVSILLSKRLGLWHGAGGAP